MATIQLSPSVSLTGKYANRHGLIAGATGTGKTVTLQKMIEGFSALGTPVFVADVKGDIAGLAVSGKGDASPVAFYDVFGKAGEKIGVRVSDMGPDLLARLLDATDAQKGMVEQALEESPSIGTLGDLLGALQSTHRQSATLQALVRKIKRFARQSGSALMSDSTFDIQDFFGYDDKDAGVVNILAADKLYQDPLAYSAFMMWLLDALFQRMPEAGDLSKPRFVLFIDEAHLLFQDAPPALIQKIERTVRLIRSKGVGVYFVTQSPDDVPAAILGQLGHRVQHALRGATLRDQQAIKAAATTMPVTQGLDAAKEIMTLGIGEALVSVIMPNGVPSPVRKIKVDLPNCRLGAISDAERKKFSKAVPQKKIANDPRPLHPIEQALWSTVGHALGLMPFVYAAGVVITDRWGWFM